MEQEALMYLIAARVTFMNETMKKSVNTYMAQEVDKSEEIYVNFRAQLSENVSLVVNLFESEDMANK